jgi:hypothetical protein
LYVGKGKHIKGKGDYMYDKNKIEIIKKDLEHQLKFEHMDWDHFLETAKEARELAININENFTE